MYNAENLWRQWLRHMQPCIFPDTGIRWAPDMWQEESRTYCQAGMSMLTDTLYNWDTGSTRPDYCRVWQWLTVLYWIPRISLVTLLLVVVRKHVKAVAVAYCLIGGCALRWSSCSCSVDCNTTVHDTQIAEIRVDLHATYVIIVYCAVRIELDKAVIHV